MSYFPPPPPPPPPRAQNYAVPNYPLHQNSFRGRGSREHRGRGSHANFGDFGRPRSAYRPVSNARGYKEYPGHDGDIQLLQPHSYPYSTQQNNQKKDYKQPYNLNSQHKRPGPSPHSLHNNFRNDDSRGQKRGHREAFGRGGQAQNLSKGQGPPPVPSFGGPLPLAAVPPPPQVPKLLRRKNQTKSNQLGLTPNTEGYESNEKEEEDDQDEEEKLASAACGLSGQISVLQVNYKGYTSTLQSSSDIAIWIAERKRRFPTKERVAEAAAQKKQRDQAQKEANVAHKQQQKKQIADTKGKKRKGAIEEGEWGTTMRFRGVQNEDDAKEGPEDGQDASAKRRRKVEGFRRLEKESKYLDKAKSRSKEWKRSQSPVNSQEQQVLQNSARTGVNYATPAGFAAPTTTALDLLTPSTQPTDCGDADLASLASGNRRSGSISTTSSTLSEDLTSSSGSTSSDEGVAPEERTSKRGEQGTEPLKQRQSRYLCKYFLANGRCRSGASCRFKHELPKRGSGTVQTKEVANQSVGRVERVSLYQRLVEQERKNEEEAVLRAIINLGDKGILDQPGENAQVL